MITRLLNHYLHRRQPRKRNWLLLGGLSVIVLVFGSLTLWLSFNRASLADAVWFDDSWAYRKKLTIGNTGAADTNKKVKFDIDTAALITAGQLQSDCDDMRFTDLNGKLLRYYLDTAGGACNTSSTDYYVLVETIQTGDTVLFNYYGNPSAPAARESQQFTEATFAPTSGPTLASEEKAVGPIAYWKFDEGVDNTCSGGTNDACDTTAKRYDAVKVAALWKSSQDCSLGNCIYFDGSGDYIDTNQDTPFDFGATNFSVSTWVRRTGTGRQNIMGKWDGSGGWYLQFNSSDQVLMDIYSGPSDNQRFTSTTAITDKNWHHIVCQRTSSTNVDCYMDGNLLAGSRVNSGTGHGNSSSDFFIGGYDASTELFAGFIDEVKIYNYARSAAQIKNDFNIRANSIGIQSQSGPSSGLVAYYKMDEVSANTCSGGANDSCDSSGNSRDMLWASNPPSPTSPGKYAFGLAFDGTNDYASVTDHADLDFGPTEDFTLAMWAKRDDTNNTDIFVIKNTGATGWELNTSAGTDLRFWYNNSYILTGTGALPDGNWHHIAVTIKRGELARMYVDGTQVASAAAPTTDPSTATSMYIGTNEDSSQLLDGTLDELRVYTRALTPNEVQQLYKWAPGPLASWKMDENTGQVTTYDSSGNGYNLSFGNGSTVEADDPIWKTGKYGSGLYFDGGDFLHADAYVNALEGYDQGTIEGWFKHDATSSTLASTLFSISQHTTTQNFLWIGLGDLTGSYSDESLWLNLRRGNSDVFAMYVRNGHTAYKDGLWHHFAISTGTGDNAIYIDGVRQAVTYGVGSATTAEFSNISSHTVARVGDIMYSSTNQYYFTGVIDNLNIYSYAHTPTQITQDYNGGHPIGGSPISSQVGYWKFDEQTGTTANNNNSAQSSLTGSISGATWRTATNCKINGCLEYDGTNDVTTVTNATATDLNENLVAGFTISAWIYADSDGENDTGTIYYKSGNNYFRVDSESGGRVDLEGKLDLGAADATLNISSALAIGTWNHVAMSWTNDSDDEITIWVNGVARGTSTDGSGNPGTDTGNILIGGNSTTNFDGKIDDFKLYASELTAESIRLDMNANASLNFSTGASESSQGVNGAPTAPLAHYLFDENTDNTCSGGTNDVCDHAGSGLDGAKTNMTTTNWVPGKYGSSLQLDGSDDYVNLGSSSTLNLTGDLTISAWIKTTNTKYEYIVNRFSACGNAHAVYSLDKNASNNIILVVGNGSTAVTASSATNIADGRWHHIAGVISGTSVMVYVDGVLGSTVVTTSGRKSAAGSETWIGDISACAGTNAFTGNIDEVKISNVAFTQAQIAYEMNRGRPSAHWKLDECQGTTAYDSSGNNYSGTIFPSLSLNTAAGNCLSGNSAHMWYDGAVGKFNASLGFDGNDNYVQGTARIVDAYPFTLVSWIKTNGTGNADNFLSLVDVSETNVWYRIGITTNNKAAIQARNTTGFEVEGTTNINDDNWHLIVGVFNSATDRRIYVDGRLENTDTNSSTYAAGVDTWCLGRTCDSTPGNDYIGLIDEAQVFPYALSVAQMKRLMNQDSGVRYGPTTGQP